MTKHLSKSTQLKHGILNAAVAALRILPPKTTLRFLFRLDRWLYFFQGQLASTYGGGTHTKHRHTGYHDFFVGNISQRERVLDIGCGKGEVAHQVAEQAQAGLVVAIDLNLNKVIRASQVYAHERISYCVGNALQPFLDGSFDTIILSNILEHLPERSAFLRELVERFAPRHILVRVPLFERDWRVPLKKELGVEWRLDPTHQIEYTIESFANEMSEAGFTISHQEIRWGEIWAEIVPTSSQSSVSNPQ